MTPSMSVDQSNCQNRRVRKRQMKRSEEWHSPSTKDITQGAWPFAGKEAHSPHNERATKRVLSVSPEWNSLIGRLSRDCRCSSSELWSCGSLVAHKDGWQSEGIFWNAPCQVASVLSHFREFRNGQRDSSLGLN